MDRIVQQASAEPVGSRQYLSREQLGELRGAEASDVARIEQFATAHHLTVTHVDRAARTVSVEGSLKNLEQAFGVELRKYELKGHAFRARSGQIQLPQEIAPAVEGVLELDTRPAATHVQRQSRVPKFPGHSKRSAHPTGVLCLGG